MPVNESVFPPVLREIIKRAKVGGLEESDILSFSAFEMENADYLNDFEQLIGENHAIQDNIRQVLKKSDSETVKTFLHEPHVVARYESRNIR